MSSKHSRALSRLEYNSTSLNRVQDDHVVNESQRKSKKTEKSTEKSPEKSTEKSAEESAEKSIRPSMDEMFLSRFIQRGARRSLPRRKDQGLDLAADLQGQNAHVRSLLGRGLVGIAILFRPKVGHPQVHMIVTLRQSGQGL